MFYLGKKSLQKLEGVHPKLVDVVKDAIKITTQDFSVFEGVRTAERQNKLFNQGYSEIDGYSERGMHQIQDDGFSHAVDLVPYIDGRLVWEWNAIFPICDAVKFSATNLNVPIKWGGSWRVITDGQYRNMTAKQIYDRNPSWDGAHFEIPKGHHF